MRHQFTLLLLTIVGFLSVNGVAAKELAGTRPNIILVMTDDQGMGDLSCLGNEVLRTPNIDRFSAMSTRFTEF
ncbi:MAG: sulfatase-like hydrolase/transferase, partial [Planctomycetia bacterium]|nr:sulfatase-like hydrolase/transferase [Planctomycetia bacterium]